MKVFISYSRLDSDLGKAVYNYLYDNNHEVFIDTKKIVGGEEWSNVIETEISKCDRFIIILTLSSINQEEVKKEIDLAINKKKMIIPCIHSSIQIKKIPSELKKYHGIQFEEGPELGRKLLAMINVEGESHKNYEEKNIVTNVYEEKQNVEKTTISSAQLYLKNAKIFERLKQNQRALINYEEALKIDPDNFDALFSKVLLLFKIEKFDEALQSIERAIDLQPENQDVWYYKGIILEKLNRYDEALEALNTDLHIGDKDIKSWTSKAKLLEQMERYTDALEAIDKITNLDSDNIDVFEHKGKIFEKLKRYEDAINCYDKVLAIDVNNNEVIKNKKILEVNLKKQRYSELISKIEPLFYQQKDYSTVIDLCDKAIDIDRESHFLFIQG